MARDFIPYFNASYGESIEGLSNWSNATVDYTLLPLFLLVFYGLGLYIVSKNEWKLGPQIALVSLGFFIVGMISQTFTRFNQLVIFIFAIGIIVGIVISYVENAKT